MWLKKDKDDGKTPNMHRNIQRIGKSFITFEKGTLIRATNACMKSLKYGTH